MRSISLFLTLLLLIEFAPVAQVNAATVSQTTATVTTTGTTSGAIEAKIASNKIGALLLADGLAALTATGIQVTGKKDRSSPRESQLSGILVKEETYGTGHGERRSGWAFFNGGPNIGGLNETCPERVELNNGDQFTGHIIKLTADNLDFQDTANLAHHFDLTGIKAIHSPKVFNYTVSSPSGQSQLKISFNATCTKAAGPPTKTSTKVIALIIAVAIIATAIAVPVAVAVATHHPHHSSTPLFFNFKPTVSAATTQAVAKRPPHRGQGNGGGGNGGGGHNGG